MKIKYILMVFFLLAGSLYLQGQPPYDVALSEDIKQESDSPQLAPCATIVNFEQKCEDNGDITVTFNVKNNTSFNVSNVWVYLDNFTTVASFGGTTPSGGISPTITYTIPTGATSVCFNIRLLNTKGQPCCYTRRCVHISECPCAEIDKIGIDCLPGSQGSYEFCFDVTNPAYSTNTIDVIMFSSAYPDLCIDGIPAPAPIPVSPIAPGNTSTVCVTLSGCSSSIPSLSSITITPHLLQFSEPSFCCDLDPITIVTPNCCDSFTSNASSTQSSCNMTNGTATISVSNGTAPYTISGIGSTSTFSGSSIILSNLSGGTYNYTVIDANGCETTGSVTIIQLVCTCNLNVSSSGGLAGWVGVYTVTGNGFLCFNFNSVTVPDQLIVTVNGVPVINSGFFSTNGTSNCPNGGTVTTNGGSNYTNQTFVTLGDVVVITVIGDPCGVNNTVWSLGITCQATPCPIIITPPHSLAEVAHQTQVEMGIIKDDGGAKEKRLNQSNSLKIFPNPVRETLNIQNNNSEVKFEVINILDASGKIIKTNNMSGNSEIRVDVSSLPRGIYFIDAMDSTGNKVTERFVKVN